MPSIASSAGLIATQPTQPNNAADAAQRNQQSLSTFRDEDQEGERNHGDEDSLGGTTAVRLTPPSVLPGGSHEGGFCSSAETTPSSGIDVATPTYGFTTERTVLGGGVVAGVAEQEDGAPSERASFQGEVLSSGTGVQVPAPTPSVSIPPPSIIAPPSSGHAKRTHRNSSGNHPSGSTFQERKFRRRFPGVGDDEVLIDYYSCALVSEILLQGILYISANFFAFYSNIFGYKTRLLIPLQEVLKVTKERTAKIIPNAVGVSISLKQKYVFASLLSRDATYKRMYDVWSRLVDLGSDDEGVCDIKLPVISLQSFPAGRLLAIEGSGEAALVVPPSAIEMAQLNPTTAGGIAKVKDKKAKPEVGSCHWLSWKALFDKLEEACINLLKLPRTSLMLLISTLLLVILFASASIVMYRITLIHRRITMAERNQPDWMTRWSTYQDVHRKQNKFLSEEVIRLTGRLKDNIDHLNQIRLPLEELFSSINDLPDMCHSTKPSTTPEPLGTSANSHSITTATMPEYEGSHQGVASLKT